MGISLRARGFHQRIVDLSVGRKLFHAFASLTVLFGVVVGCLFLTVSRLGEANHQIVDVTHQRLQAADQLRFAASDLRAAQQAYLLRADAQRSEFELASNRFDESLNRLSRSVKGPVELALVAKISTGYQTFLQTDLLIWQASQAGNSTVAANMALGPESLAFGFIAADTATLVAYIEGDRLIAVSDFRHTSSEARNLGIALGVAALMVMAFSSWAITRLIRNPLQRVQEAAERAANGDLDAVADVRGADETGRLAEAFNTMLSKLRLREATLRAEHHRQNTTNKVQRAFEMAEDEASALDVVGLTIADVLPGQSAELLLADNSKANLEQAVVAGPIADGPGCPVASPFSCVAVRSGAPKTFSSSTAVDACPHLRNRGVSPCSAVCVPVTFMGRAMGVIHAVGDEHHIPESNQIHDLTMVASQAGARLGMLRTMQRTAVQASTDSMTGLMNRRVFETRIRALRRNETSFALVMADVDHFKRINDTYGHETGDRALKTFCDVAKQALRHSDMMARWGGEEFAFAFPDLQPEQARDAIDRIRLELSVRLSTSDLPGFTVSYGIVAAETCASLQDAIRLADDALYEAKAAGRDRAVLASAANNPRPTRVADKVHDTDSILAHLANEDQ